VDLEFGLHGMSVLKPWRFVLLPPKEAVCFPLNEILPPFSKCLSSFTFTLTLTICFIKKTKVMRENKI
jgi:hypothetical protein